MKNSYISHISALEVLDSRGNPTIEVTVNLESGVSASAVAPSGASTGSKEAYELRDGDSGRFYGKGVLKAVANVEGEIAENLIGFDSTEVRAIDSLLIELDGTPNKKRLGANAVLATSIACAKAAASYCGQPLFRFLGGFNSYILPTPMMNVINGGAHVANGLAIQEFMIIPVSAPTFREALRMGAEVFASLKKELQAAGLPTNVGDEGGFAPNFKTSEEALGFISKAVEAAGYKVGSDIFFALDAAATEFKKEGKYNIDGKVFEPEGLVEHYIQLSRKYPIISIEDPLAEDEAEGFKFMTSKLGSKMQIVGDDLFCTNRAILQEGIRQNLANAMLVKFNQIGTLSETMDAIEEAKRAGYNNIISHRSGESEDVTIAHLSVATNAGQIKTGSLARTDRTAKYNELLRIERALGETALYAGASPFKQFGI